MRKVALKWWNDLSFEEKFLATIAANAVIQGDHTRHPESLTGSEIELVYRFQLIKPVREEFEKTGESMWAPKGNVHRQDQYYSNEYVLWLEQKIINLK